MKVVSLFSGCGGTDLGFHLAGHNIIYANDIDKTACETYKINFPDVNVAVGDIRKIKSFPEGEILLGCYPCQGFSYAGKREPEDSRNMLYLEFARALRAIKPKFFVVENVKGMLSISGQRIFKNMLKLFKRCGYRVSYKLLNAQDYGVPQNRERVFIVGVRKDINFDFQFPEKTNKVNYMEDALDGLPRQKLKDISYSKYSYIYMSRNRKKEFNETSFTIQAGGQHAPLHPKSCMMVKIKKDVCRFSGKRYRRLSYRECARVQSFPDSFKFSGGLMERYKQVGNAVPPLLSFMIASKIPIKIEDTKSELTSASMDYLKIISTEICNTAPISDKLS